MRRLRKCLWPSPDFQLSAPVFSRPLCRLPIFIPSFGNFTGLRTLRALRPLRTLRFVPGMPVLISSIFAAIPPLGNVVGLASFLFLIFGIVGEELFEGTLHYWCDDPHAHHDPSP